ncbi:MAG: RidA family protein [Candidatus Saccharibacteria bacterium]
MKQVVLSDKAPRPVGPYSQAVISGQMVFCSGQIGLDPQTGKLAAGVELQAKQCILNLQAVLTAAGYTLDDVVKTTIYVTDIGDFKIVNEVYAHFFEAKPPARSTVGVASLPLGAAVEIEAVASR